MNKPKHEGTIRSDTSLYPLQPLISEIDRLFVDVAIPECIEHEYEEDYKAWLSKFVNEIMTVVKNRCENQVQATQSFMSLDFQSVSPLNHGLYYGKFK